MTDRPVPPEMETGELAVHIVSDQGANDHVLLLARGAGACACESGIRGTGRRGPTRVS